MHWFQVRATIGIIILMSCAVGWRTRPAGAQDQAEKVPAYDIPAREDILKTLKTDHPRLLIDSESVARIRKMRKQDPRLDKWCDKLVDEARAIEKQPVSEYRIPDGKRLLATSRRVLGRTYTLGMAYLLEGDDGFKQRLWNELEAAANFKDWNPSHFLDTAEMTHAFGIGYDWLYDAWTPEQRKTLREAMVRNGLEPALKSYRGEASYGWWVKSVHNWNPVCNGGISMGALAIADEEPERAAEILDSALHSIPRALASFAPEGAWGEGVGYWGYTIRYTVPLIASLESALGTNFGITETPGFDQTGFFPIYMTGPTGDCFNFADSSAYTPDAPELFWLGKRFDEPAFVWFENKYGDASAKSVLWYLPAKADARELGLPLDRYFRGVEVATMRGEWENPKTSFVGIQAGTNAVNHSHLDLGSFVFESDGVRWAMDLGGDNYNLPGYFGGNRWHYYRLRTEGHNTLVINPDKEPAQQSRGMSPIVRFESNPESPLLVADLSTAYKSDADEVLRGMQLLDRKRLLIQDEIACPKPSEIWWFMHTRADVELDGNGRGAVLKRGGERLRVDLLAPEKGAFRVMEAAPLPSSPHPEGQNANRGVRKLAVRLEGIEKARIAVLLTPGSLLDAEQAPKNPVIEPIAEW